MAAHTRPHRAFCYHGTGEDVNDLPDSQNWQDMHNHAVIHSACANRAMNTDTTSLSTASQLKFQNDLSTSGIAFNDGSAAPIGGFNGYTDFIQSSGSMLPSTGPLAPPVSQFDEWNNLFPPIVFTGALHDLPSAPNTYDRTYLNHLATFEDPSFSILDNNTPFNIEPSTALNDDLLLTHEVPYVIPSGDGYGHAMNHEFLENCMSDLQQGNANPLVNMAMSTQHPVPSIPGPNLGLSLYEAGQSFLNGQEYVPGLSETELGDRTFPFPSSRPSNDAPQALGFLQPGNSLSSTSYVSPTVRPTAALDRPLKQRRIMPRSMNSTHETTAVGVGVIAPMQSSKKLGRTRGFPKDKRVKVLKVRHKKACSNCFASHTECSVQDPCLRCVRLAKSSNLGMPCNRDNLQVYLECLLPPFMCHHLRRPAIEKVTNSLNFIRNEILIELSTGYSHPPIKLLVCEFVPPNRDFLYVSNPTQVSNDNMQSLPDVRSLEWGVLKCNVDQLNLRCLEHIQTISNRDTVIGEQKTLAGKFMGAICRFRQADPIARTNDLLSRAITVNRLHYVLGTNIFFSSDSVDEAITSLQNIATDLPCRSRVSSRILTKQVKGAMNDMLIDNTTDLLGKYNTELRDKRSETRLICLLTHFILCMCAELVQNQVDGFITFRIPKGDCDPIAIRRCGTEVCRRVEHEVLKHSWVLLRGKLRSFLKKRNPFKHGYQVKEGEALRDTELNLINEIRQIMNDHKREVFEKASKTHFGGASRTLRDAEEFRKYNSGRILSKFIRMLY